MGGGSSVTHSQSVIAEEASEAAAAVLQGEGLPVGGVGGGLAGVEAAVAGCRGGRVWGVGLARGGCPASRACAPILEPQDVRGGLPGSDSGSGIGRPALALHPL